MGNISKIKIGNVAHDIKDKNLQERVAVIDEVTSRVLTSHQDAIDDLTPLKAYVLALAGNADWTDEMPWDSNIVWHSDDEWNGLTYAQVQSKLADEFEYMNELANIYIQ